MSGLVVGVPALRLELQEDRDPFLLVREVHEHAAILKHSVIGGELAGIALVHVDVVDAVARQEAEVLVLRARLRSPALTEGVHQGVLVGHRALHHAIELLVQVVVEARDAEGQRPHLRAVEEIASDEVERS